MGMYTELLLKCQVKANAPEDVMDVIRYMFAGGKRPEKLPEHVFFSLPNWDMIGDRNGFYHHDDVFNIYHIGNQCIFSNSYIKNYSGEIQEFLEWIKPYIDAMEGQCIGWTWYEEELQPTLIIV